MNEKEDKVPKRRLKEFENEDVWKIFKIGDVTDGLYNGQTPSRVRDDFWNGNINWLSSGELNRSVVKMTSEKITVAGQNNANLRIVPQNTFVMAITGLEAAGTRGNCGILGIDTTLNQSCMAVFPNENLLNTHFLFQWYKMVGEKYGIRFTQGTKQQSYNAEIINKLDICLPKIKEQSKIGMFFSELDTLIALHQNKLEKMKALKKAYLTEMFPAEGERRPKRRFAGFTDDWEQRKLGECCSIGDIDHRMPPSVLVGIPYVMTGDFVGNNDIDFENAKCISEEDYQQLALKIKPEKGDILFARYASVGTVRYVEDNRKFLISYSCAIVKPNKNIEGKYLYYYLKTDVAQQKIELEINTGSQRNIGIDSLKNNIVISVPKIDEQIQIGAFLTNIDKLVDVQQHKLEKLQNIKKAYLNEMFV